VTVNRVLELQQSGVEQEATRDISNTSNWLCYSTTSWWFC
jgi:hypothetical protein